MLLGGPIHLAMPSSSGVLPDSLAKLMPCLVQCWLDALLRGPALV